MEKESKTKERKRFLKEFSIKDRLTITIVNLWEDLKTFDIGLTIVLVIYTIFCNTILSSADITNFLLFGIVFLSSGIFLGKLSKKQGGLIWEIFLISILNSYTINAIYHGIYYFLIHYLLAIIMMWIGLYIGRFFKIKSIKLK